MLLFFCRYSRRVKIFYHKVWIIGLIFSNRCFWYNFCMDHIVSHIFVVLFSMNSGISMNICMVSGVSKVFEWLHWTTILLHFHNCCRNELIMSSLFFDCSLRKLILSSDCLIKRSELFMLILVRRDKYEFQEALFSHNDSVLMHVTALRRFLL